MGPRTMSADMKWYCLLTVEEISHVRKVFEAAEALHAKMERGEFSDTGDEQAGVWGAVEEMKVWQELLAAEGKAND